VTTTTTTLLHPFNGLFFLDNPDKPAPERQTILDFTEARDDGVAVASAGPYANHLHLAPEITTPVKGKERKELYLYSAIYCNTLKALSTSPLSFYRPDALPAAKPTASKQSTEGKVC